MNVRNEIECYADEQDKVILRWLFKHYHLASEWNFVARCRFTGEPYPNNHRVWYPTVEGKAIYYQLSNK